MPHANEPEPTLSPQTHPLAPLALIDKAIEKGVDPDKLGKLMDLQERWEKNRAAEAYAIAIAEFQKECPTVLKQKAIPDKEGNTKYKYAPYEAIKDACQDLQARCGIVTSFDIKVVEGSNPPLLHGTISLRVGAHVETRSMVMPIPVIPNANASQMYVGASSYLKRALYTNALDIPIAGEDRDGVGLYDHIDAEQLKWLEDTISEKNINVDKFIAWGREASKVNFETLADMPASIFAKARDLLKQRKT